MNNQEQARIEKAGRLSVAANRHFLSTYRELLVSFDRESLASAILSHIRLHSSEQIRENDPSVDLYLKIQEETFLRLLDKNAIAPVAPITSLGQQALDDMRRRTNIGLEALPQPELVLTPAQKMENQIREDWSTLSSAAIRRKMANDRLYRETFERISGELESHATTFTAIQGA
jgi:hypothetical protein